MEFYQELLLTAVISILLALLIGKLAGSGDDDGHLDRGSPEKARAPADPVATGGVGAGSVKGKRVRFRKQAGTVGEIREESVGDAGRAVVVLGSGAIEANEVGGDEEKTSIGAVPRTEKANAGEPDLAMEVGEEKGSEVEVSRLEEDSMPETMEIEKVDVEFEPDGRSAGEGAEVEIIRLPEETLAQGTECEIEMREEHKGGSDEGEERMGSLLYGEDEWEGIERSEMEKLFGVATAYVNSASGGEALSRLSSDLQMQLYALHKVATEGPCYEPQPLALKVSARAKWHAWQRLGNMNPEVAMEQYISLLSDSIPGWMVEKPGGDAKQDEGNDTPEEGAVGIGTPDSSSSLHSKLSTKIERELKDPSFSEGDNSSAGPELSGQGLAKTFFLNLLSPTTVRFLSFYW